MQALDTNVLIRYLAQDDAKQEAAATRYIGNHCTKEAPCFIGKSPFAKWTGFLEQNYDQDSIAIENVD